eukprot:2481901-Amphidinium_carterae.1
MPGLKPMWRLDTINLGDAPLMGFVFNPQGGLMTVKYHQQEAYDHLRPRLLNALQLHMVRGRKPKDTDSETDLPHDVKDFRVEHTKLWTPTAPP